MALDPRRSLQRLRVVVLVLEQNSTKDSHCCEKPVRCPLTTALNHGSTKSSMYYAYVSNHCIMRRRTLLSDAHIKEFTAEAPNFCEALACQSLLLTLMAA